MVHADVTIARRSVRFVPVTERAAEVLRVHLAHYPVAEEEPVATVSVSSRPLASTGAAPIMRTGHFYQHRWTGLSPHEGGAPHLEVGIRRSVLAPIRPLVDREATTAPSDLPKVLHEVTLPALLQTRHVTDVSFVHAATMVSPAGQAVLITGEGGVGKTSLALTLGRRPGWSFLADDLTPVDVRGDAHLNANWPKIYAYNAEDDPELVSLLLRGRSLANKAHWYAKQPWPTAVRRSIDPEILYGDVAQEAPIGFVLLVERADSPNVEVEPITPARAGELMADTLARELRRLGPMVEESHPSQDAPDWTANRWEPTITRALDDSVVRRIVVPRALPHDEYLVRMATIVDDLLDD